MMIIIIIYEYVRTCATNMNYGTLNNVTGRCGSALSMTTKTSMLKHRRLNHDFVQIVTPMRLCVCVFAFIGNGNEPAVLK